MVKISLKGYDDLGKYCWPNHKEVWDTNKDKLYVVCYNFEKQPTKCEILIESLDDLIPFLWRQPPIQVSQGGEDWLYYSTCNPGNWWDGLPRHEFNDVRKKSTIQKLRSNDARTNQISSNARI